MFSREYQIHCIKPFLLKVKSQTGPEVEIYGAVLYTDIFDSRNQGFVYRIPGE